MKTLKVFSAALLAVSVIAFNNVTFAGNNSKGRGSAGSPVVYVTSQELFYDSIVLTDVPFEGNFQKLEMGGPSGLQTEFGPGDEGHYGGRWWVDVNDNGEMDEQGVDHYFLCPLLGPGRDEL